MDGLTPVFQTKYGKHEGNCLTACVASILEVPIETVPEFCIDGEWFERLSRFCEDNGFSLMYWKHHEEFPILCVNINLIVLLVLEGEEDLHAVIGKTAISSKTKLANGETNWTWESELVHDPNERGYPPVKGPIGYIMISKQ